MARRKPRASSGQKVANLHATLGDRGVYLANRVIKLVSAIYTWGEQHGYLREGHPNPARGVKPFPEKPRDRWLTREELPRLLVALKTEPNVYVRAFFRLLLLTGARKSELLNARWSDVDLDNRILRIPETKGGRTHYLPLSGAACEILGSLPREAGNPHVFPGRDPGTALVNVSKPWIRLKRIAGLEDLRIHDLRRTVGSWLAQGGESLYLIGRILNHQDPSTTQVYAHLTESHERAALERHGEALLEVGGLAWPDSTLERPPANAEDIHDGARRGAHRRTTRHGARERGPKRSG